MTSQEIDSKGFYVFRAIVSERRATQLFSMTDDATDDFVPLTGLIPSKGKDGGKYSFVDETGDPKAAYLYLLVERKTDDTYIEYRDLIIPVGQQEELLPFRLYLPVIIR